MRRVLNAIDRVFTLATAIAFSSALIAVALTVADVVLRAASSLVGLATGQRAPWAVPRWC